MSIPIRIQDGTGTELEATVKKAPSGENTLAIDIANIDAGIEFQVTPSVVGIISPTYYKLNGTGTIEANVNGAVTPQDFKILAPASTGNYDLVVDGLVISGLDGGIKLNSFFAVAALTNGLTLTGKADDVSFDLTSEATIKKTHDIEAASDSFEMRAEAGNDSAVGRISFNPALILRRAGTTSVDDYLQIRVQDDLSTIAQLRFRASARLVDAGLL